MRCGLDYCIYNKDFFCILKEPQLNSLSMCEDCIIISIPNDVLKELKERQLEELNSRWKNYE